MVEPEFTVAVVVPCYNEARRFDSEAFAEFLDYPEFRIIFVDDGSTDDTESVLRAFCARAPEVATYHRLERNAGKAEAVRRGLLIAFENGYQHVGYLDADLATPIGEFRRLAKRMKKANAKVVLGSRMATLGTRIERKVWRHYVGRVFSTAASLVLNVSVYDTQCGAKLFAKTDALVASLQEPFMSRWAFDVELLGRLLYPPNGEPGLSANDFLEVPLTEWRDVAGSKLTLGAMLTAGVDLARIAADVRRRSR